MTESAQPVEIEFNPEFRRALELMEETDSHVFITGRAGTGKSTLLQYFRYHTRKNAVILAPTGVAAVNVGGQTIHSFFHFKPNVTLTSIKKKKSAGKDKPTVYKKLTAIVIDEVSMVHADLLDCVDKFLRLNARTASSAGRSSICPSRSWRSPSTRRQTRRTLNLMMPLATERLLSSYIFARVNDLTSLVASSIYL